MTFIIFIVTLSCLIFYHFKEVKNDRTQGLHSGAFVSNNDLHGFVKFTCLCRAARAHVCYKRVSRKARAQSVSRSRCVSHNRMSSPDVVAARLASSCWSLAYRTWAKLYLPMSFLSFFSYSILGNVCRRYAQIVISTHQLIRDHMEARLHKISKLGFHIA